MTTSSGRASLERQRGPHEHPHAHRGDLGGDVDRVTVRDLAAMAAPSAVPMLSLYLPTHRIPAEGGEDRVRLKDLLASARRRSPEVAAQIEAIEALASARSFWSHQTEGLVLLSDASSVRRYRLPVSMPELAVVGKHRHLKPLLELAGGDGSFLLLELHQRGVRLFEGSKHTLRQLPLAVVPGAGDLARHSGDARDVEGRTVGKGMIWFGGAHEEGAKERAERYFRLVDAAVAASTHVGVKPLVLAGLGWLESAYRRASRHPALVETGIPVDTSAIELRDLHQRAWECVAPCFARRQTEIEDRHAAARGSAQSAVILSDIIALAQQGRVASLLVASDRERWGGYSDDLASVTEHGSREQTDEDLLNLAAVVALRTGAEVYAIPASRLGGDDVSAVLRF